jgi:thiol-disulfide isomerase/thioredoxin
MLLAVPGGEGATPGEAPAVDMARLEAVEDLSESLANGLMDLSAAMRRRDMVRVGEYFSEEFRAEPFASLPGPTSHEIKWIFHHAWGPAMAAPAGQAAPAVGRGEFLGQVEAFLAHFSEIEEARFDVKEAQFENPASAAGETRIFFALVGRDTEGKKEWVRGTFFITAVRGAGQTWKITRWRTDSLGSDLAAVDLFSEISHPAGIASSIPPFGVPPNDGFASHGGAAADFDGDGLLDLVVTEINRVGLYLNDGKGAFHDASEETLISLAPRASAALPLDYDNDGDVDVFLSAFGRQALLENRLRPDGKLVFQDVSDEAGVDVSAIGFSAVAADVNGDGLPDIYVTSYNRYGLVMPNGWGHATNGTPNLLFINQGGGRFREAAHRWGVDDGRWSLAAAFADVDGDGRQDLYVTNDFGEDGLFMNRGEHFEDEAAARGVQDPGNGMGAAFGDYDNDGDLDLHVTNMSATAGSRGIGRLAPGTLHDEKTIRKLNSGDTLYDNDGTGRFRDVSEKAGPFEAGWAWGGGFVDFDNDGWEDKFDVNGFISGTSMQDTLSIFWRHVVAADAKIEEAGGPKDRRRHMGRVFRGGLSFSGYERDCMYLSLGDGTFREISGVSGTDSITDGRGAVFGDFDNDGDLDIFATSMQKVATLLYRNEVGQDGSYLRVTLEGSRSGRDAFGAVVRIKTPLGIQTKIKAGGSGFLSSHDPRLLFGLGREMPIEWLEVAWPSGGRQRLTGVRAGESLLLREDSDRIERVAEKRFRLVDPDGPEEEVLRSLGVKRGDRLPSLALVRTSGERSDLERALKAGRRTLLNFWAASCAACRQQMQQLQRISGRLAGSGVDLVGISLDYGEAERVRSFLAEAHIDYPVFIAEKAPFSSLIKGDGPGVPFSLVLDEKGTLVRALAGWSEKTRLGIEALADGR